jgi:protein involved in polysaccharide export with SLBB domain
MKINRSLKFALLVWLCLVAALPVLSQTIKNDNFSDIRVDALSDIKVRDFMREVESLGLSLDQIDQVALSRGMSAGEVKKLKARVERIRQDDARALRESRTALSYQDSVRKQGIDSLTGLKRAELENQAEQALTALRSKIFGSDIFKNRQLSFEPNVNIAPPQNYQVGSGDEVIVDIFGYSEMSYTRTVSPEGTINIPYAGVVQVAGLSLDEIRQKLTRSLSSIYTGIRSGNTFVRVTTGKLRSIKVTIIGEATRPGTYTLSSVSTVFTALYAAGGPTENGSFRRIEILRGNRVISTLDVYDFLLRGDQKGNITLRDQDVIRIPVYEGRVEFDGEVKRPRIFEVLENETLADVLNFAGGFTNNAYTGRVKVLQNTSKERRITDVSDQEFSTYKPQSGDKFVAEPILDRFENRVQIEGAVFRPGAYELEEGLTLRALISKAEGLRENAFVPRGYITRTKADGQLELISFNTGRIVSGDDQDIALRREDVVTISSIFDLKDEYRVSIDGEVRSPGQFDYAESMSLEDLILKAGGLKEGASISRIEVARRVNNSNKDQASASSAEIFQISIENDLSAKTSGFVLQPFDIVSVRQSEGYEVQRHVKIEGEVKYPGIYFITRKNERISDLISRAGGTTVFAYTKGASLERGNVTKLGKVLTKEEQQKEAELEALKALRKLKNEGDSLARGGDTTEVNRLVGIDLERILSKPGSDIDLFLEEGDLVHVPKQPQTVKISGNVLLPTTAIYIPGRGFKSYISQSGGFKQNAAKRRSYIKYANGSVKSTKKILLFVNNYPRVTPGSEIVVPVNQQVRKVSIQEILGISTGLISTILLVLTLTK